MRKILIFPTLIASLVFGQANLELPELGDRVSGAISQAEVDLLSEQFCSKSILRPH